MAKNNYTNGSPFRDPLFNVLFVTVIIQFALFPLPLIDFILFPDQQKFHGNFIFLAPFQLKVQSTSLIVSCNFPFRVHVILQSVKRDTFSES